MSSILKVDTIQNTGGTTGLTIDSSGRPLTPARPAFKAYSSLTGWQSFGGTSFVKMPFNSVQHNIGTHYDTSNYKFVVPCNGVYYFYAQFYHDGNTHGQMIIKENGSTEHAFSDNSNQGDTVHTTVTLELTVNDYIETFGKISNSDTTDWYAYPSYSYFCGYLIG